MEPIAVTVPRLSANDDVLTVQRICVSEGVKIEKTQLLAEIEGDKTTFEIYAEAPGFVVKIEMAEGDKVQPGAVLLWIGQTAADVPQPVQPDGDAAIPLGSRKITAKARALLQARGLDGDAIMPGEPLLSAAMVEAYLRESPAQPPAADGASCEDGEFVALTPFERGMANTVAWHASTAVPAYLEVPFDHEAWRMASDDFERREGIIGDVALSLLAYQLVRLVDADRRLNAVMIDRARFDYKDVNLGFSIKTRAGLVMAVLRDASRHGPQQFIRELRALQKKAHTGRISPTDTTGATVSLTSLARAGVLRHVPLLPPKTSLIVAHSAKPRRGDAVLGATYDHRLLDGEYVALALQHLATPNCEGLYNGKT